MSDDLRCWIPWFDGGILRLRLEGNPMDGFVMSAPRLRMPSEQQYSDRQLRSRRCAVRWDQPEDSLEVAETGDGRGSKDLPKAAHSTTLTEAEERMVVAFR